jgi:hypothetical protein
MERLEREGVNRLFIVYAKSINMNVHSVICSCSDELYKLWYSLADFLPNWNFRGVFSIY